MIASWLRENMQRAIAIDDLTSRWVSVKSAWTPTGTVLGPLMVSLYINDNGDMHKLSRNLGPK